MNREIKFRVWDEKFNCWDKGGFYIYANELIQKQGYIIQQYTGLKDKNGKEIYEGDIIKTPLSHMFRSNIYEVKYHQNRFTPDDICDGDVEIIGNIFENKNLIDNAAKI
jgi:hypothetical protein